jgi:hypothetical protein
LFVSDLICAAREAPGLVTILSDLYTAHEKYAPTGSSLVRAGNPKAHSAVAVMVSRLPRLAEVTDQSK